jgi:homoserine O-acetyltransferase
MTDPDSRPEILNTGAVGRVETRFHTLSRPFTTQAGDELPEVTLAYEIYGEPAPDGSNIILVFHAITGSAHAAGYNPSVPGVGELWTEDVHRGWWDGFIGNGRALDTSRYAVMCVNYLGGCYGSTGPRSKDPETGRPYGSRFPQITLTDIVDSQALLLDELGFGRIHATTGGSVGGMMAAVFAARYPDRVDVVVPVASGLSVTTLQALHNFEQIVAIVRDPGFEGGDFYDGIGPESGLALARMIGHKTFVSLDALTERAGEEVVQREDLGGYRVITPLESYMLHHAQKFVRRFDANSYLVIMRLWQQFDMVAELGANALHELLERCRGQRWQLFTIDSDVCFYPDEQMAMAAVLKAAGVPTRRYTVHSDKGHDAFLTEPHLFEALMRDAFEGWQDRTVHDPGSL